MIKHNFDELILFVQELEEVSPSIKAETIKRIKQENLKYERKGRCIQFIRGVRGAFP